MKNMLRFSIGILLLVLLTACSSSPAPAEFTIEMKEFEYSPDTIEVQVGQEVTIHLVNVGALDHEFMVGHNPMMMDNSPSGFEENFFDGREPMVMGGSDEHAVDDTDSGDEHAMDDMGGMDHGFMVMVPRQSSEATLTFTVTEDMVGEWEIGCFAQEGLHYEQGMHGTLIVNP